MEILLPNAERRMCARHIWANWKKNGEVRKGEKHFGGALKLVLRLNKIDLNIWGN